MSTVLDKQFSPRTLLVLGAFVKGPMSRNTLIATLAKVPESVVSSAVTRLVRNKLIAAVGKEPDVKTSARRYGITKLGVALLEKGPGMKDRVLDTRHGGTYSRALPQDWVAPRADRNVMKLPTYVPTKIAPARPDADEHLQHKSKGI